MNTFIATSIDAYLWVPQPIGPELAIAVLTLLFYTQNNKKQAQMHHKNSRVKPAKPRSKEQHCWFHRNLKRKMNNLKFFLHLIWSVTKCLLMVTVHLRV